MLADKFLVGNDFLISRVGVQKLGDGDALVRGVAAIDPSLEW